MALLARPKAAGTVRPDLDVNDLTVVFEQLATRVGRGDLLEEVQELAVAMPRIALVGHLAGGHLQGREQRGAVPDVVVGAPLGWPGAQATGWLGALQVNRGFPDQRRPRSRA